LREEGTAEKATYILNPLQVSVQSLERQLQHYVTATSGETPFDIKNVQIDIPPVIEEVKSSGAAAHKAKKPVNRIEKYLTALRATPQLEEFGPVFKSSDAPQNLTEAETEYKVRVIKHTYKSHIVLQFEVMNTLEDQLLEDVLVEVEGADGFEATHHLPAAKAKYNEAAITYTVLEFAEGGPDEIDLNAVLPATLKFKVKDVDPNDPDEDTDEIEAYEDEYALEDVELAVADHVQRIIKPNFQASWDQMDDAEEVKDTYQLSTIPTLEQAVKDLQKFLGLYAQEKTDKIPEGQGSHTLLLAGVFRGGIDIMAKSRLVLTKEGVTMELTVRSTDIEAAQFIASAVA
jgi:coatomer protein complex subunit gamma